MDRLWQSYRVLCHIYILPITDLAISIIKNSYLKNEKWEFILRLRREKFQPTNEGIMSQLFDGSYLTPYVHSTYSLYDFHTKQHKFSYMRKKGYGLGDEIEKTKKVSEKLKKAVTQFFGRKMESINLWNLLDEEWGNYTKYANEFLMQNKVRNRLVEKFIPVIDESLDNPNLFTYVADEIVTTPQTINAIAEQIAGVLLGEKGFKGKSAKAQRELLEKEMSLSSDLTARIKSALTSKKGVLKQVLKTALEDEAPNLLMSTRNENTVLDDCIEYIQKRIKEEGQTFDNKSLPNFKENLARALTDMNKLTPQMVSGGFGETVAAATIWSNTKAPNGQKITAKVVGDSTELILRKELDESIRKIGSLRGLEKYSYTDLILYRGSKTARVQSKTYVDVAEAMNRGEKRTQYMKLSEDRSINEFLSMAKELVEEKSIPMTNEDLKQLSYALANDIWFQYRGTYDKKTGNFAPVRNRKNEATNTALNMIFLNYLGVMIDENWNLIPDLSNLFFLLNNRFLVPTYVIVDDLITIMQQELPTFNTLHAILNTRAPRIDAQELRRQKLEIVKTLPPAHNILEYMYPTALREVSMPIGKGIIEDSSIHVTLSTNLDRLIKSSYDFLKK